MIEFSSWIRKLRQERNMSQEDLASLVKVSPSSVGKWEEEIGQGGKPILPHLLVVIRLAEIFGMSLNDFLGVPIPKPEEKKLLHIFPEDGEWFYFYLFQAGGGREKIGPFSSWASAHYDLKQRLNLSYSHGSDTCKYKQPPYKGVSWYPKRRRWVVRKQGQFVGQFIEKRAAVAAAKKWEKDHGYAQRKNDVHSRRRHDDVGPGPGQCGPKNRDVGERLQGDEATVRREEEALPCSGSGISQRLIHSQDLGKRKPGPSLSDIQKIVSRNQLPWKVK